MYTEEFLAHYGIKGQKWGERRFQNPDGTWTAEGKARYGSSGDKLTRKDKKEIRKEYRADKQKAFELGRDATVSARAADIARKKEARAQKRYDRRPNERRKKNLDLAKKLRKDWDKTEALNKKLAEEHLNELAKKYGKEHVKGIKYDKKGRINERTSSNSERALSLGLTGLSLTATALGSPVGVIFVPSSANQKARSAYEWSRRTESAKSALKLTNQDIAMPNSTYRQRQLERDSWAYRREHDGRHA